MSTVPAIGEGKRFYGTGLPGFNLDTLTGKLVVIEGSDGSGRSTQIALLREWLERLGHATAEVGLKRSELVSDALDEAKQGNVLCPITLCLFYATDFADQLEYVLIPALRSGFVVLADRYIYTLMARAVVRGVDPNWVREVYSIALVPDAVFYLDVSPRTLAERIFQKNPTLDYWESGMDIRRSGDMYQCFLQYQRQIRKEAEYMQAIYRFETVNGNRSPRVIQSELQSKIGHLLDSGGGRGVIR